jgi:hypothetical protein
MPEMVQGGHSGRHCHSWVCRLICVENMPNYVVGNPARVLCAIKVTRWNWSKFFAIGRSMGEQVVIVE